MNARCNQCYRIYKTTTHQAQQKYSTLCRYYYCLLYALMSCSMHALQIQRQSICHHLKFIISKAFLFSISQNRTIHLVIIYYLSVPYRPFMFILWQSIKIDKNISYKQILKVVYRVGQVCCIGMWIVEPIPICTVRNTICIIKIQLKKICLNGHHINWTI